VVCAGRAWPLLTLAQARRTSLHSRPELSKDLPRGVPSLGVELIAECLVQGREIARILILGEPRPTCNAGLAADCVTAWTGIGANQCKQ